MDHTPTSHARHPHPEGTELTRVGATLAVTQTNLVPKPVSRVGVTRKLTLKEITQSDPLFTQPGVGPELTEKNAGGRFVLAPANEWKDWARADSGGFICKIMKVDQRNKITTVKFSDTTARFHFNTIHAQYKTLT